jgi:hypothetical protein
MEHGGFRNEFAAQIPAWNKPVARRRRLINTILQIDCAFVFCFRAKEKAQDPEGQRPRSARLAGNSRRGVRLRDDGALPIRPGAQGVPTWSAKRALGVPKREDSHVPMFKEGQPLDEETGAQLAQWAAGAHDWQNDINAAETEEALKEVWARIPRADQPKYKDVKDKRKAALPTGAPI